MHDEVDLRRRLSLASAQLVIDEIDPHDMVMLACDLIAAGASGEATLELAIQSPKGLLVTDAEDLLRDMLAEWDMDVPDPIESANMVALDLCDRLLAGTIPLEVAAHRLLGALAQGDDHARTAQLLRLLERLEDELAGRADDALRSDLEALARDIGSSAQPLP
jgi:hypothetical protein